MLNNPLFLQTKIKIETWRKAKKHLREPIPDDIRKDISELAHVYPATKIGKALKLSDCSLRYLNANGKRAKKSFKPGKHTAEFIEFTSRPIKNVVHDQKKIELDLPMGMTLRIFL